MRPRSDDRQGRNNCISGRIVDVDLNLTECETTSSLLFDIANDAKELVAVAENYKRGNTNGDATNFMQNGNVVAISAKNTQLLRKN